MQYSNQLTYPERKIRLPRESSLSKKLGVAALAILVSTGGVFGLKKYNEIQEKQLEEAFSNTCGITKININNYNQFGSDTPYAIALRKAENLREKHQQRFEKVSNEEMSHKIMKSYNEETGILLIPKFDCDKPQ